MLSVLFCSSKHSGLRVVLVQGSLKRIYNIKFYDSESLVVPKPGFGTVGTVVV